MSIPQTNRNAEICRLYVEGLTLQQCADRYHISRQRVRQILRAADVFKKDRHVEPSGRDEYLGIDVRPETKVALREMAKEDNTSVSAMVSDLLDAVVKQ